MFSYIMLGTNDLPRAIRFYDPLMEMLGQPRSVPQRARRIVGDIQRKPHHRAVHWQTVQPAAGNSGQRRYGGPERTFG